MGTNVHVTTLDWGTTPRQKVSPRYVPRGGWTQPRVTTSGNRTASAVLAPRPTRPNLPAHLAPAAEKQPKTQSQPWDGPGKRIKENSAILSQSKWGQKQDRKHSNSANQPTAGAGERQEVATGGEDPSLEEHPHAPWRRSPLERGQHGGSSDKRRSSKNEVSGRHRAKAGHGDQATLVQN